MRDVFRVVVFVLAAVVVSPIARAQTGSGDAGEMLARVEDLRRQVAGLRASLRQRDEWFDALRRTSAPSGRRLRPSKSA